MNIFPMVLIRLPLLAYWYSRLDQYTSVRFLVLLDRYGYQKLDKELLWNQPLIYQQEMTLKINDIYQRP